MKRAAPCLLVLGILLFPRPSLAQTPPAAPPPPPRLEGTGSLSFVTTSGNSSTAALGTAVEVFYRPLPYVLNVKGTFVRNSADGIVRAQAETALARLSRDLRPHLAAFVQYDLQRDLFAGIVARHTIAGGVTFTVRDDGRQLVRVDGGMGAMHEAQLSGASRSSATALGGVLYRVKLSESGEFSEDVRIVAALSGQPDRRVDQTTAATAKLTSRLSLKASYVVHYASAPVPGFKHTDTQSSVAIVLKF